MGSTIVEIYSLVDPVTGLTRYVGQSVNATKRLAWHIQAARRGELGRVYNWIRTLLSTSCKPVLSIIEGCPTLLADEREIFWIRSFRSSGFDLTNLTDGGGGRRGYHLTPSSKERIGAAHKGKVVSTETRGRLSLARKGKTMPPETRAKISKSNLGRELSLETRKKLSDLKQGNQYATGLKRSPETLLKMRQASKRGSASDRATLTDTQAREIRNLFELGARQCDLARSYRVTTVIIHRVVRGKTYLVL
jgi:hypothetical protein